MLNEIKLTNENFWIYDGLVRDADHHWDMVKRYLDESEQRKLEAFLDEGLSDGSEFFLTDDKKVPHVAEFEDEDGKTHYLGVDMDILKLRLKKQD